MLGWVQIQLVLSSQENPWSNERCFWHLILFFLRLTLLRVAKEFSSVSVLHIQTAVTERAQTCISLPVLLQKLLFFMQTTRAFSIRATRPHCQHHLVLLCLFREILTGPRLPVAMKATEVMEEGRSTQAFYLFSSLIRSSPPSSSPQWFSPSFAEILGSRHFQQGSRKFPSLLSSK